MSWYLYCAALLLWLHKTSSINLAESKREYWRGAGESSIDESLKLEPNTNVAKNVIFFLGDGMSIATVTAAAIYKGQKNKRTGEEEKLAFEQFPYVSLIKTYSVDKQVPDSAGTATAFLTGVKTRSGMLGLTAEARYGDCSSAAGNEVLSIMKWSQDEGKDTGFVTTTRVTHATPAALYARIPHRDWEGDAKLPANASDCKDIARQLIEDVPGKESKVIFGGGRRYFMTQNMTDNETLKNGERKDGIDLISEWEADKARRNYAHKFVTNLEQFKQLNPDEVDFTLGLFEFDHMQYEVERNKAPSGEPSIAEMTQKAISILSKNPKGYFLLVEGGRIDHAHHETKAAKALEETLAMEEAVAKAMQMTSPEDTLIIVTADHSHVMTINGYPDRGNPILGLAQKSDMDNKSYTTLMYTNGPGYAIVNSSRPDAADENTMSFDYTQQTAVPLKDETHSGEEVALYARGPMSHLFHGVQEQNYIALAMGYASCVGPNKKHCEGQNSASSLLISYSLYVISLSAAWLWRS